MLQEGKGFVSLVYDLIKEFDIGALRLLETHMNGDRVKYIISRVPFDKSFIVDAQGHASGLWCL